ncbi:MAG: patatin-like phospholipase family protein [Bacteroidetes bacterium]|nr:patatin-like phospholipase family protein [Bacteroidota bacterium]
MAHRAKYLILSFIILCWILPAKSITGQSDTISEKPKRPKVGLVMSGGGAKGWAYIGLLKVMQEVGLEVDYIAGSSAGSIVGAMYALGYDPDTMLKIIREVNWDDLLTDKVGRQYINYEEKEFGDTYIMAFPIRNKKLGLKASMYEGQEINLMLNRVYSAGYNVQDFSKLPTPFLCIGTDLLSGEAVILDKGYLPMAIRASMSIPAYFSPTFYDGKYLIDGGVVNNYPVKPVKDMGVDYIIGADVQQQKTLDELNSMTSILDHIIGFYRGEANKIALDLTDMYIHFNMSYGMMDFTSYDSIIAIGERVARQHYDELKNLADSLNAIEYKPMNSYHAKPLDSVYIHQVIFKGNNRVEGSYFKNTFGEFENSWMKFDDLEDKIRLAYGSRFFTYLFYELRIENGNTNLVLNIKEADIGYLSVGAHFDTDYSVSLLLNGAFRNVIGKSSKIFTDLVVGPNPRFRGLYIKDNGAKPGYGGKIEIYSFSFNTYQDPSNISAVTERWNFTNFKASLFAQKILRNRHWFRIGGYYEYFRFKSQLENIADSTSDYNSYANFYFSFNSDTRDRSFLATKGILSELRLVYVTPLSNNWVQEIFEHSFVFWLKYDQSVPLSRKLSIKPGFFLGGSFQKNYPYSSDNASSNLKLPPAQHWFYMGGQSPVNYVGGFQPFTGVNFVQRYGIYQAIFRLKLQYNFYQKLYATIMADVGATEWYLEDIFKKENWVAGYGIKLSYDSFIGPVEVSMMGSNIYKDVSFFINLGYWF